jgi:hypothetical protein
MGLAGASGNGDEAGVNDDVLDAALVATARARHALGRAGSAWAAARVALERNARDPMVRLRRTRCGLRILGLPHDAPVIGARAAIHARACPGGERGQEIWVPLVHRMDAPPSPARLQLIRGGASRR